MSGSNENLDLFNFDSPQIEILSKPMPVYRMRYKKDGRRTNLFAKNDEESESDSEIEDNDSTTPSNVSRSRKQPLKIRIKELKGPALLVVCCVTSEAPHFVHPNILVGENCQDGYASYKVGPNKNTVELTNIRIQLLKKSEIPARINQIKEIQIDPFANGFDYDLNKIDMGKLRLCFQLYNPDPKSGLYEFSLFNPNIPVLSDVISTSKQKLSILIQKKINLIGPVHGGTEVVVFVKTLEKDQKPLLALFFKDEWSQIVKIDFIHYKNTLIFKSPAYKDQNINSNVKVNVKLFVPNKNDDSNQNTASDSSNEIYYESEHFQFEYTPNRLGLQIPKSESNPMECDNNC